MTDKIEWEIVVYDKRNGDRPIFIEEKTGTRESVFSYVKKSYGKYHNDRYTITINSYNIY